MPPSATLEDIKAYQDKVEKDNIAPDNLPPCPRCCVESEFFKIHAYRERRFLIIIEMLIKAAYCSLVRFKCPGCGKTFTYYPDFAIPHKHYTRPSITGFSAKYLKSEHITYRQVLMVDDSVPGYPQNDATLAATTIHRWITTLSGFTQTCSGGYSPAKIQNQKAQKTTDQLPAADDHQSFFSGHLQNLNFHQVGIPLCLWLI